MKQVGFVSGIVVCAGLTACGGSQSTVTCGEGTVQSSGTCVPAISCGEGTELRDGVCVVMREDEPDRPEMDPVAGLAALAERACACKDAACIETLQGEMTELARRYASEVGDGSTGAEEAEQVAAHGQKYARCAQEVLGAEDATPAAPAVPVVPVKTGVPECDKLVAMYTTCDKLPAQAREAFAKGSENWKKTVETGGEEARKALAEACQQASAAAEQALKSVGCP